MNSVRDIVQNQRPLRPERSDRGLFSPLAPKVVSPPTTDLSTTYRLITDRSIICHLITARAYHSTTVRAIVCHSIVARVRAFHSIVFRAKFYHSSVRVSRPISGQSTFSRSVFDLSAFCRRRVDHSISCPMIADRLSIATIDPIIVRMIACHSINVLAIDLWIIDRGVVDRWTVCQVAGPFGRVSDRSFARAVRSRLSPVSFRKPFVQLLVSLSTFQVPVEGRLGLLLLHSVSPQIGLCVACRHHQLWTLGPCFQ